MAGLADARRTLKALGLLVTLAALPKTVARAEPAGRGVEIVVGRCIDTQARWVERLELELHDSGTAVVRSPRPDSASDATRHIEIVADDCELATGQVLVRDSLAGARRQRQLAVDELGREDRHSTLALIVGELVRAGPPRPTPRPRDTPEAPDTRATRATRAAPALAADSRPTESSRAWDELQLELTLDLSLGEGLAPDQLDGVKTVALGGSAVVLLPPHGVALGLRYGGYGAIGVAGHELLLFELRYLYRLRLLGTRQHGLQLGLDAGPAVGRIAESRLFGGPADNDAGSLAVGAVLGPELIYRLAGWTVGVGPRLRVLHVFGSELGTPVSAEVAVRVGANF